MTRALLVNPWIEDFTAYDLWLRPLGLLHVGAMLEAAGVEVALLDCLAREDVGGPDRHHATGRFPAVRIAKPAPLAGTRRHYYRFGMSAAEFDRRLAAMAPPDLVLVAGAMTYWYGGAFQAARRLRAAFPRARLVLGGVYAALCPDHARRSGLFDEVVTAAEPESAAAAIAAVAGRPVPLPDPLQPAWHLYPHPLRHAAVLTGRGCPFRCTYCATPVLHRELRRKAPAAVLEELRATMSATGAAHVAFYDDALLAERDAHFRPILEGIARWRPPVRFHLPNAVHPRYIDRDTARLLRAAGFVTIRLGFEGMGEAARARSSGKVDRGAAEAAAGCLRAAGFTPREVAAYLLFGLPGLDPAELEADIRYVHRLGIKIQLASFSPIPGTPDFERARAADPAIADEPLRQNKTLTMLRAGERYRDLQLLALALNARLA
jgi:hypothetical protein